MRKYNANDIVALQNGTVGIVDETVTDHDGSVKVAVRIPGQESLVVKEEELELVIRRRLETYHSPHGETD